MESWTLLELPTAGVVGKEKVDLIFFNREDHAKNRYKVFENE